MKRFLIKRAGQPFGSIEVDEVGESETSPSYVLKTAEGKLLAIVTTPPGVVLEFQPEAKVESKS